MMLEGYQTPKTANNKHYGGYNGMEKITKKSFVEALTSNVSVLVGNVFNKSDEAIQTAIDGIKELNKTVTRSGKASGKYINFTLSNGKISSLALNDAGSHDYFIHKAKSGIYYIQKTTQENDYGCEIRKDVCYCVYAIA